MSSRGEHGGRRNGERGEEGAQREGDAREAFSVSEDGWDSAGAGGGNGGGDRIG